MKRNIVGKGCVSFAAAFCLLCGCAQAPGADSENGISYAVIEGDEYVSAIIESRDENTEPGTGAGGEESRFSGQIGSGGSVMRLDAAVTDFGVRQISVRKACPDPEALDIEAVKNIFFGGGNDVIETDHLQEADLGQENGGEEAVVKQMDTASQLYLDSPDGNIHFSRPVSTGFNYRNDALIAQYKEAEGGGTYIEETDKDISAAYTAAMAEEALRETLGKIYKGEIEIISRTAMHDASGKGCYEFVFVPMVGNLPLAVNDRDMNLDRIVDVFGRAQIGQDGISLIEANNFLWKDITAPDVSQEGCISLEKALEILEHYISEGEIPCSEEITFTRATLAWMPVTDNWSEAELVPVWRFYLTCAELVNISMSENIPTDICINAINGEIENML